MSVLNTFVDGGALFASNGTESGKILNPRFGMFNYKGHAAPAPGLMIEIEQEDGSVTDTQFWSCGKASDWKPSEDGKKLIPISKAESLVKTSNVALLLQSLFDAGFDPSKLDADDISVIAGLNCDWIRKSQKRSGMEKEEQNVLIISAIKEGDSKASGNADAGAADDTTAWAIGAVVALLSDPANANGLKKVDILQKLMVKATTEKQNIPAVTALFGNDNFLKSSQAWKYENGVAKLA